MSTKRKTTEIFISESKQVHGNKYDYSKVEYINNTTKVCIICPEHGEFWQRPLSHINAKGNCPICSNIVRSNALRLSKSKFIKKCNLVHKTKYDYRKVNYKNSHSSICIICPKHGEFWQKAGSHLEGHGCSKCNEFNIDNFIEKSNKIHRGKYDYSKTIYINSKSKVDIICPIHGKFKQLPSHHMSGCGCPVCNKSKGEKIIEQYLIDNNYFFLDQYRFYNCRNKRPLPFDFYLPDLNLCIEYDGEQHFIQKFNMTYEDLERVKLHDKIKTEYCKENNIRLLRINYKQNIKSKLDKLLK